MIPTRRVRPVEVEDDIPTRLAHLRAEQRNRPRAILTSTTQSNSPSRTTAFLLSDLQPVLSSTPVVGLPPSWEKSTKTRRSDSGPSSILKIERRRRLISPLPSESFIPTLLRLSTPSESIPTTRLPTLSETILRLIARDLAEMDSIYRTHLEWIPSHVRIRLLDVAAVWAPLDEVSVLAILSNHVSQGEEMTLESGTVESTTRREDGDGWEEQHDRIDFHSLSSPTTFPFFLTSLNLSFAKITIEGLKRLLIAHASPSTPPRAGSISLFPHLVTLKLAHMPLFPISQPLFDILSSLLRLRHLNLAGNFGSPTHMTTTLSRLALATPHLITVDLSEMDWVVDFCGSIDLSTQWRELKRMGLRDVFVSDPYQMSTIFQQPYTAEKEQWLKRVRGRRWIEVIE